MNRNRWLKPGVAAGLALTLSLVGCVVEPARVSYATGVVVTEPPAAVVESIGVAPVPGYVWIGGYWSWVGGRHVWVAGRWSEPRAGFRWAPHEWVRVKGGWRLREGRWERVRR
jgi:hypothetical protein